MHAAYQPQVIHFPTSQLQFNIYSDPPPKVKSKYSIFHKVASLPTSIIVLVYISRLKTFGQQIRLISLINISLHTERLVKNWGCFVLNFRHTDFKHNLFGKSFDKIWSDVRYWFWMRLFFPHHQAKLTIT